MKILRWMLLCLITVALLSCTDTARLKVHNKTAHLVFFTFNGESYTVNGGETKTVSVDITDTNPIFGSNDKSFPLMIRGETFQMVDANDTPFYSTTVTLTTNKTLSVYAWPNFACVKVINDSTQTITHLYCVASAATTRNGSLSQTDLLNGQTIPSGGTFYQPLAYETANETPIVYDFTVVYEDGTQRMLLGNILELDQVYLIR